MGYDMNLVKPADELADLVAKYNEEYSRISTRKHEIEARVAAELGIEKIDWSDSYRIKLQADAEHTQVTKDLWALEDPAYFRLNIWGMGFMRRWMTQLAMINEICEPPRWPKPEEFGVTEYEVNTGTYGAEDGVKDEWGEVHSPAWLKYKEASDSMKAAIPDQGWGIAWYKLGTNDGWLVTPTECEQAIESYRESLPITSSIEDPYADIPGSGDKLTPEEKFKEDLDLLESWVGWLGRAVISGGFRVY